VLYWKGTHAFAKRQRELGDRFVARPVFTRKGATYVGLVPLDEQENVSQAGAAQSRRRAPAIRSPS
jgi:hypothetical protein